MMTIEETKSVRVSWFISADIECPHCGHTNDFMEVDEFWVFSNIGENKDEFVTPVSFECTKCKEEFNVNGSDY